MIPFRVGIGNDTHRLVEGRSLVIGGVTIPHEKGLLGHSDADVLVHAICDALLGAAALGDIGRHFPDTDPAFKGADSLLLLESVVERLKSGKLGNRQHRRHGLCASPEDRPPPGSHADPDCGSRRYRRLPDQREGDHHGNPRAGRAERGDFRQCHRPDFEDQPCRMIPVSSKKGTLRNMGASRCTLKNRGACI